MTRATRLFCLAIAAMATTADLGGDTAKAVSVDWASVASDATIPAPGAILLGSIGAGLVTWLRRRRTL